MTSVAGDNEGRISRRELLAIGAAAAGTAAVWTPAFRVSAADAAVTCAAPPGFPPGIDLFQQAFSNWAQEIVVDNLWTCAPQTPADIVTLANWAVAHDYRLRPRGMMHGWSPLTVTGASTCGQRMVLVDLTQNLTSMEVLSTSPGLVRVQAGATMDQLLGYLEQHGLGFNATPAPGDITIGGALAIDAHGTSIPAVGETRTPGHSYGSLSNLVVSLTAVVWDRKKRRFTLRTFGRGERDCRAFLVHLGRAFITEFQLRAGANNNLRCVSYTDIPATELFAAPGSGARRTFAHYIDESGRAEAIWFTFTDNPWLKVWSVSPEKPAGSRKTDVPYNYVFANTIPTEINHLATLIVNGEPQSVPLLGAVSYGATVAGLAASQTADLWGPAKNTLLYVKPTTLRTPANGYAVTCRRADIQRVVHEFTTFYSNRLNAYRARGLFPMAPATEIRVTGLDHPGEVGVRGARSPALSAVRPRPDHPEWDVAVWLDAFSLTGQPGAAVFFRELEEWIFGNFKEPWAAVRPEWSKGWAYSSQSAWSDARVITRKIPAAHRAGRKAGDDWDWAVRTLDSYDPHRVFSNDFLDRLLVARKRRRRA